MLTLTSRRRRPLVASSPPRWPLRYLRHSDELATGTWLNVLLLYRHFRRSPR